MTRRGLAWLVGILAALAVLAGLALLAQRPAPPAEGPFLPGLRAGLNDVNRIVVTGPGNTPIATLEKGAERWTVAGRNNYPADVGRIRKNLLALADARIVEEKTANPEFYPRLGVQDLSSPSAGGVQLTLSGGKEPVDLIIGQTPPGASDLTYVRRAGEAASWLIAGRFDLGRSPGEWLDRTLTNIPADRIASVTIDHPGLETLRITRAPDSQPKAAPDAPPAPVVFQVAGIPAGRELSYPGIANGVAGALADLQLEDVDSREALGPDQGKPVVARFVTTDGLVVETSAWRVGEGTRVTFSASGEGEAARKEAEALNARLGGWVYSLPELRTEQLTRRLQELLAP